MTTIERGYSFQLNRDGTRLICGYETCRLIDLESGDEYPWDLNGSGAWYPGGWNGYEQSVVFMPTQDNPPMTEARWWSGGGVHGTIGLPEQAIGHAGLAMIDGQRLSTNGSRIWFGYADITPEPFLGVVWSDIYHYGYKRGWDGGGPFVVRRTGDNVIVRVIDAAGLWERPYTLSDGVWVAGQYSLGSWVQSPSVTVTLPARELPGPVFESAGVPYVVSAVMGAQQNPRGVMVRPWTELVNGTLRGWYLDGVRHQQLQARVRPDGMVVVGGAEFPGSGLITIAEFSTSQPMGLVPPETVEPPIDPPVDPPDGGDMTEAQYQELLTEVKKASTAAQNAETAAKSAETAAKAAVLLVTDAPVRIPYLGTGRLNPK